MHGIRQIGSVFVVESYLKLARRHVAGEFPAVFSDVP